MSGLVNIFHNLVLHHRPHWISKFEGFYSKFHLPSGAYLIIIVCTIKNGPDPENRNQISITYYPAPGAEIDEIWQTDIFAASMPVEASLFQKDWTVTSHGHDWSTLFRYDASGFLNYKIEHGDKQISFNARSGGRIPWSQNSIGGGTPESLLVYLPLPLHWHVHSFGSKADFSLSLPAAANQSDQDKQGIAIVHEEKNWAVGFPTAHNWIQGRNGDKVISLAGGRTIGMDAFLVGYRNPAKAIELDFRPPWALKIFGLSPFMSVRRDWEKRELELAFSSLRWKLQIKASAPHGSFFSLAAPYPDGFKDNWLAQSMRATIEVQVSKRAFPGAAWQHEDSAVFENGGLEFGGDYYPARGTSKK